MLPPSMAPWHVEHLNERSLRKQQKQEDCYSDLFPLTFYFLKKGAKAPFCIWRKGTFLSPEKKSVALRKVYKQSLLLHHLLTPQQTRLSSQFFTNILFLCLKGIKASSDHFLESSFSCESSQFYM